MYYKNKVKKIHKETQRKYFETTDCYIQLKKFNSLKLKLSHFILKQKPEYYVTH